MHNKYLRQFDWRERKSFLEDDGDQPANSGESDLAAPRDLEKRLL